MLLSTLFFFFLFFLNLVDFSDVALEQPERPYAFRIVFLLFVDLVDDCVFGSIEIEVFSDFVIVQFVNHALVDPLALVSFILHLFRIIPLES